MFGAANQELPQGKNYIKFGIHKVEVVDLTYNDDGTFDLKLKNVGASDEDASSFRFYVNNDDPKANEKQMRRFYEIICAIDKSLEQLSAATAKDYIELMTSKIKGKQYIQKFAGRQSQADGPYWPRIPASNRTVARPEPTIACSINEEPPFTFDKTNEWDYRTFGGAPVMDSASISDSPEWDESDD